MNLFIAFSSILHAQDLKIINQSIEFIELTFVIKDSNPMEKQESDSINNIFQITLKEYQNKESDVSNTKKVLEIFNVLYDNGVSMYSDSDEERRMKQRRAECFASIALLSDFDTGFTFFQYAKIALADNLNTPNIEFMEEQYLGLLIMEVTFKYINNQLNMDDLNAIYEFIKLYQTNIDVQITNRATSLLNNFK